MTLGESQEKLNCLGTRNEINNKKIFILWKYKTPLPKSKELKIEKKFNNMHMYLYLN